MLLRLKVRPEETIEDLAHQITGTLWSRARWSWETGTPVHLPYGRIFRAVRRRLGELSCSPCHTTSIQLELPGDRSDFEADLAQTILRITGSQESITPLMVLSAIQDSLSSREMRDRKIPGAGLFAFSVGGETAAGVPVAL